MNAPTTPETIEDLMPRFESVKEHLTEAWLEQGIAIPPTNKEVWGQLRATASFRMDEAMMDDMEYYVNVHQHRIKLIDIELQKL